MYFILNFYSMFKIYLKFYILAQDNYNKYIYIFSSQHFSQSQIQVELFKRLYIPAQ